MQHKHTMKGSNEVRSYNVKRGIQSAYTEHSEKNYNNKKAQLSLTNPRDAAASVKRFI